MADERNGSRGTRGSLHLGESFGELGPGLGRLHAAWREGSDQPALVLIPGEDVDWKPDGPWRVSLACDPAQDAVTLDVEQAPAGADVSELANTLVLMAAAVERAEDKPQVRAHIARGTPHFSVLAASRVYRNWSAWGFAGVTMFALGLGLGLSVERGHALSSGLISEMPSQTSAAAPYLSAWPGVDAGTPAYPLPAKPFSDQATAPCDPQRFEEEINKGCWLELAHRPPCLKDVHLEHQGKCYVPVAKHPQPRQSIEPGRP